MASDCAGSRPIVIGRAGETAAGIRVSRISLDRERDGHCGTRLAGSGSRFYCETVVKFLLWLILLFLCWPLALLALLLWPLVWLLLLPFRLVGIAVEGVFDLLRAIVTLPARVLNRV